MKLKSSYILVFALIISLSFTAVTAEESNFESISGEEAFEQSDYADLPSYVQDLKASVVFGSTVQERIENQRCTEFENETLENGSTVEGDCLENETVVSPGDGAYVFDIENIETEYKGNGDVYVSFVAQPNDLTKNLHLEERPATTTEEFVEWFNENYLFNGENLTVDTFDDLKAEAESVRPSSLEGEVRGERIENSNLMSDSGRMEFVVSLQDFRSGGVQLNDGIGVVLESSASTGGASIE